MNPYELMLRSGVLSQYRPVSRWQERRLMKRAMRRLVEPDKTWQVVLLSTGIVVAFCVLFVRWWMCV